MQHWTPEETDRLLNWEVVNQIALTPGFEGIARASVECWLPKSDDSRIAEVAMRDLGRMVSGYWSLYLDSSPGGLILSRLAKMLENTSLSSPGRARALLIYLRFIGYVELAPGQDLDGRERRFRVTSRLKDAFRERYRRDLTVFRDTDPAIAEVVDRLDDEDVLRSLAWAHGAFLAAYFQVYKPTPISLDTFSGRYSGMVLLARLLLSGEADDRFPPRKPVPFTVAGLARETGISRAQVRRLLRDAEAVGFMTPVGEGKMALTTLLAQHVLMFIAAGQRIMSLSARAALAHLQEARDVA